MLLLVVLSLALSLAALVLAAYPAAGRSRRRRTADGLDTVPEDLLGLRQEVAALRTEAAGALRHLGSVRYDAFPDTSGHLSWSVALLDDHGDGVVLTAIHGRSEARAYAKSIAGWRCEQPLSPEEEGAVTSARAR